MQEQEKKPLVLKEILGGSGNLYCPSEVTHFVATKPLGSVVYLAQLMWLSQQLPSWVALLNEKSGALVRGARISYEIKHGRLTHNSSIVLELAIKGGLFEYAFADDALKISFLGQLRKLLAERVLTDFPPSFDCQKLLAIANWPIEYYIKKTNDRSFLPSEVEKIKSDAFLTILSEELRGQGAILESTPRSRGTFGFFVRLELLSDSDSSAIIKLQTFLHNFFRDQQIAICWPESVI